MIELRDVRPKTLHGYVLGYADISKFSDTLRMVTHAAIAENYNTIVSQEEEARLALVRHQQEAATEQLVEAIRSENMARFRSALASGADVMCYEGADQQSPLHLAVQSHDTAFVADAVATLLQAGSKSTAQDIRGRTPFHIACLRPWSDVTEAVLSVCLAFSPNPRELLLFADYQGMTCFHVAASACSAESDAGVVMCLLSAAAQHNIIVHEVLDSNKYSPLHYCKSRNVRRILKPKSEKGGVR